MIRPSDPRARRRRSLISRYHRRASYGDSACACPARDGSPGDWVRKGIGRAVALALAAEGWRRGERAHCRGPQLVREAPAGAITPFVLDVTDPLATAAVIARVNAEMGPIALAILNAGTHRPTPLAGFSASDLAALIDVNLMGVAHGLAALLAAPTPARDIAWSPPSPVIAVCRGRLPMAPVRRR